MAECPKCWMPMDDFSSMCIDCYPDDDEIVDNNEIGKNCFIPINIVIWILKELVLWEINIDIAINYVKSYWNKLDIISIELNLLEEIWKGTYIWTMIKPLVWRKYRAFKWCYDWYWDTPIEALISLRDRIINNN